LITEGRAVRAEEEDDEGDRDGEGDERRRRRRRRGERRGYIYSEMTGPRRAVK
jgi:hypothetical protein